MNIKKVTHQGGGGCLGEGGNRPNFLLELKLKAFTWIFRYITLICKQYPHLYTFYWFLMCNFSELNESSTPLFLIVQS